MVEFLDLRPSRESAQVKTAFAVVRQGDRLADRCPGLRQLSRFPQLSSHSPDRPPTDPKLHGGVRPDVPDPGRDGGWVGPRDLRRPELDEVCLVPLSDDADDLPSRLAGLATDRREHAVSGRRPDHGEGEHRGAQPSAASRGLDQTPVLGGLLLGGRTHARELDARIFLMSHRAGFDRSSHAFASVPGWSDRTLVKFCLARLEARQAEAADERITGPLRAQASASAWTITSATRSGTS